MSDSKHKRKHNPEEDIEFTVGVPGGQSIPTEQVGKAYCVDTPSHDEPPISSEEKPEKRAVMGDEIESLKQALADAQTKINEYSEGWQRERADFANYKKRIEREQAQTYQNAAANIIKKYLVILDDLERALKARPGGDGAGWAEGIELIYRKLQAIVEAEGITTMKVEGEIFNPSLHEAISQEENSNYQSGQIIEVIQQGYMLGDRVIRPALVRVAR
jgi:molecular chaperone GrpE